MPTPQICLALPNGRPLKDGKLPKPMLRFAEEFRALVPEFQVMILQPRVAIAGEAHAVNSLIEEFRNQAAGEWFVWMDQRTEISPKQLFTLLNSNLAMVGALVTTTSEPVSWDASFFPDTLPDAHGIVPVPELSVGVKVFHRSVFDKIEKMWPARTYIFDNSGRSLYAFCQEALEPFGEYNRLLSPANSLDALCRKAKLGIFANVNVRLKRRGADGALYPQKEPYRSWEFKREPPPVCVEDLPDVPHDTRPITVIFQYCDKDSELAREVSSRIFEHSHIEFILSHSPGDQYPKGPNESAVKIMRLLTNSAAKAILLLEPDCCPLTPDWLDQLSREWDRAAAAGKLIMGSWHPTNADHPTLGHLNGNLMFSPDLANRVTIPDVPDDKPWDTFLADVFAPHWCRTGLIKNLNRHKTATKKQLSTPECGTRPPVLIHGVKDDSAWNYAKELCATKYSSPAIEKTSSG